MLDGSPDAIHVLEYIEICHAKHAPAVCLKIRSAPCIVLQLLRRPMRCAVDFDDQMLAHTGKVGDVGADGMLSAKLIALKRATPEESPEHDLGFRHLFAETAGELARA